jgi:hypothetical protein
VPVPTFLPALSATLHMRIEYSLKLLAEKGTTGDAAHP